MSRLLLGSFDGWEPRWVRGDVVAGLTVWAVLVPESLAYATIAGAPPVVGLYAAVPSLVLYALVGSSRHLVVAPMSASAALSAGIVGTFAHGTEEYVALTAALAVATGLVAVLAGVLRLGFVASLISEPVLKGFIIGLALIIMIGQLPTLFGIEKGHGNFFEKLWDLLRGLPDTDGLSLLVGGLGLAVLLALRRWLPVVPGSLVVVVGSIAAASLLDLGDRGLDLVGSIPAGLPSITVLDVSAGDLLALVGPAAGVMLVGFAEGLAAAKTYAARDGYPIDSNRELLGVGVANLGAGVMQGMVVNGSLSKTAVNGGAGARSQLSSITVSGLTVVTLLFLTGLFEQLPEATLAAVVIAAVIELIDVSSLRRLYRVQSGRLARIHRYTSRADFIAAVAALLGVLVFETLPGLVIGVVVSLVLLIARTSRPRVAVLGAAPGTPGLWVDVEEHADAVRPPGVVVVRVEGPLFFGNADFVRDSVRELVDALDEAGTGGPRAVVVDAQSSPSVDVTSVEMLVRLRTDLERRGVALAVAHGVGQTRDVLDRAAADEEPQLFATVDQAVAALSG